MKQQKKEKKKRGAGGRTENSQMQLTDLQNEVVLEVGEVVLPDDGGAGVGAEHLAEDGHHGRRALPRGHHGVGHLGQAGAGLRAHLVEAVLVLDGVCQGQAGGRGGVMLQGEDGLPLGHHVPFVLQLVLPHVVGLLPDHLRLKER